MNVGVEIQITSYLINWINIIKKQKQLYEKIDIKKGQTAKRQRNAKIKYNVHYLIFETYLLFMLICRLITKQDLLLPKFKHEYFIIDTVSSPQHFLYTTLIKYICIHFVIAPG